MDNVVYVSLLVAHGGAFSEWRRTRLLDLRESLTGVGDFDRIRGGEDGELEPEATVADLLARCGHEASEGEVFFERDAGSASGGTTRLRGVLTSWSSYHTHLMPLIYAAAAASRIGADSSLSLMGALDGEVLIVLVDVAGGQVRVRAEDPQNLCEDDWNARLGGMASIDEAFRKWSKRARKRRR